MKRNTFIIIFSSLAALLAATGCDDDDFVPLEPVHFAEVGERDRHAALAGALGLPLLLGEITVTGFEARLPSLDGGCPAPHFGLGAPVYDAGDGCTGDSGIGYAGRVRVESSTGWALLLHFDDFEVTGEHGFGLDGIVARSLPDGDGVVTTIEDVVFDYGGRARLAIIASCDAEGTCTAEASAKGAIDGAGRFQVRFSRRLEDGRRSGYVELVGADTLRLDLDAARDADGCWPVTLDGAPSGRWCSDVELGAGSR